MPVPIPDGTAQKRRIALIVAGSVAVVLLLAVGAWAAFKPHTAAVAPRTFTPAEETTASGPATSSAVASALAGEGVSHTATGSAAGTSSAVAARPKIAFRLGKSLYVADEDGSGTVAFSVTEPEYALSPDGSALAVIRADKLVLLPVPSGAPIVVGTAELVTPVWMPDSSAVLFVRAGDDGVPAVWRVGRDGKTPALVAPGQGVAVSPDGLKMALLPTEADEDTKHVTIISAGRAPVKIALSGGDPIAVALSNDRMFVSTLSPSGAAAIWSMALNGSGKRELVGAVPAGGSAATYGRLMLSPDARSLAYTADGDDGYSRIWVVPVAGGSPRQVTARRDGYPMRWTADGSEIIFFEGNSFQGESSALWRSDPEGARRRMIVSGAMQ